MGNEQFEYKVISCSESRIVHESKKAWLETQGINFGEYDLQQIPNDYNGTKYWGGLNFYWCFDTEEAATMFRLKWGVE